GIKGTLRAEMKIYLDASTLNRPFDDQSVPRNRLEAEAMIVILDAAERGYIELISSSALLYENLMSPLVARREYVATYLDMASAFVTLDEILRERAQEIERQGIASLDALHLASAERAGAEWFVTCDDHILRKARRGKLPVRFRVSTPVEFVTERRMLDG
ncbi:MAG: PIN domain-containing protein, partial [Candidatus Binatia bacterium]